MSEILVLLSSEDAGKDARRKLTSDGGEILHTYGRGALVADAGPDLISELESHPGVAGVYTDAVPDSVLGRLDETEKLGVAAWNQRRQPSFEEAKRQRKGEGLSWGHPDYEREG